MGVLTTQCRTRPCIRRVIVKKVPMTCDSNCHRAPRKHRELTNFSLLTRHEYLARGKLLFIAHSAYPSI
ncbi:hypothetical protein BAUCODRAFT_143790 [Baudoinia panamericana UAMH 10762]|uniref:Uncharacterized protein n=1 Tax=Baudoinia panamericana (strain UAMH 10762) TaxID=717646 RepID=M2MXJ6_BAUPA|nr:uncharacterized protein BAUCODRAFT_143790 [Baudoinia panamericana UAMH 10762]EMC91389.1 hypothetical protein BAUCODRAFT_143790 [Baudoinia panamericana UAMH 10762]